MTPQLLTNFVCLGANIVFVLMYPRSRQLQFLAIVQAILLSIQISLQ